MNHNLCEALVKDKSFHDPVMIYMCVVVKKTFLKMRVNCIKHEKNTCKNLFFQPTQKEINNQISDSENIVSNNSEAPSLELIEQTPKINIIEVPISKDFKLLKYELL